nr:hypothetical protein [Tanacetum cinerariifolium]
MQHETPNRYQTEKATFQVVLDALALTPFHQAFLITAEVIDLEHSEDILYLIDASVDYLHQPWRAFATIINKCLSGKETVMDKICLSHAQILQGMFYKKNIDFVYLLWEDFLFHIENKDAKKTNKISYPRFTKIIIDYFMSKEQSILRRNKMFWHTARDDTMFTSMRRISKHKKTQKPIQATKGTRFKTSAKVAKSDKKKQHAKMLKAKGLDVLSKVALTKAGYQKKQDTISQLSHRRLSQDDEDAEEESDMMDDNDQEEEKEKADNEEVSSDQRVSTPPDYELTGEEEIKEGDDKDKEGEHKQDDEDDLYRDLNINLERSDSEMTDAQANQHTEDTHVTLTTVLPIKEAMDVAVQLQYNKLKEEAQAENQEFLNQVDSTMKAIIKELVQAQVSKIMPKIE